jgi:hypothetical protein
MMTNILIGGATPMNVHQPTQPPSPWKRIWSSLKAFAEAADLDVSTIQDLRVAALERRVAALEAAKTPNKPIGKGV